MAWHLQTQWWPNVDPILGGQHCVFWWPDICRLNDDPMWILYLVVSTVSFDGLTSADSMMTQCGSYTWWSALCLLMAWHLQTQWWPNVDPILGGQHCVFWWPDICRLNDDPMWILYLVVSTVSFDGLTSADSMMTQCGSCIQVGLEGLILYFFFFKFVDLYSIVFDSVLSFCMSNTHADNVSHKLHVILLVFYNM